MNVCIIYGIDTQLKSILIVCFTFTNKKSIDLAFGGSWADADVDMASISVPIEKGSFHDGDEFNQHHLGDQLFQDLPILLN